MRFVALALLLVAVVAADVAPLLHADNPGVVHGSYIVVLKEGVDLIDRDAHVQSLKETIARRALDAEIVHIYTIGSFIGFSARLTEDLLKAELAHPFVKYIEADQVVSINYQQDKETRAPLIAVTQTGATWGLNRISQRNLNLTGMYIYNSAGGLGVDAFVIDTGILVTHVDFGKRATAAFNAITTEANTDLNGHGTHCAGILGGTTYGVAKNVSLYAVKVADANGSVTSANAIAGINYVTNNRNPKRPSVASMSIGFGPNLAIDNAVTSSMANGTVYVIAAGNENVNACLSSPGRVPTVITVAATDKTDHRSDFSDYGTCVTLFAPGTDITSDWIGSNTATETISGTSMATPHVSGALALRLSYTTPPLSPADSKAWLKTQATPSKVVDPAGSPNLLLYSPPS